MITKPMLAATWSGEPLTFPLYATPKLDGIRALTVDNKLVSRTFKPIRNRSIVEALKDLPNGCDGELLAGNFQQTTHRVMKEEETEGDWAYYIFDYVTDLKQGYTDRINKLLVVPDWLDNIHIKIVHPRTILSMEQLLAFEQECLLDGYEGVIVRSGTSPYKCGRATLKEGYMTKIKRFSDAEATVVGFVEFEHNENEAEKDAFGRTKRSNKKEGMVLGGMLGKLILQLPDGQTFGCGTGFDMEQRKEIWNNQSKYLGKLVKYKYFEIGTKDLPRHPVFLGFRDQEDI